MPPPLNYNLNADFLGEGDLFGLFIFFYVLFSLSYIFLFYCELSATALCYSLAVMCMNEISAFMALWSRSWSEFHRQIKSTLPRLLTDQPVTRRAGWWGWHCSGNKEMKVKAAEWASFGIWGTRSYLLRIWLIVSSQQSLSSQQIYVVLFLRWFFTAFAICKRSTQNSAVVGSKKMISEISSVIF